MPQADPPLAGRAIGRSASGGKNKKMFPPEADPPRREEKRGFTTEIRRHGERLRLLPSPHRVLRAFYAGRCALRKMHTTFGRKRTREEKSYLHACGELVEPPRCLRGEAYFVWVATPLAERKRSDAAGIARVRWESRT